MGTNAIVYRFSNNSCCCFLWLLNRHANDGELGSIVFDLLAHKFRTRRDFTSFPSRQLFKDHGFQDLATFRCCDESLILFFLFEQGSCRFKHSKNSMLTQGHSLKQMDDCLVYSIVTNITTLSKCLSKYPMLWKNSDVTFALQMISIGLSGANITMIGFQQYTLRCRLMIMEIAQGKSAK